MKISAVLTMVGALAMPWVARAEVSYLQCDMQVTFRKPYVNNTFWEHKENTYTKSFRIDTDARMVSVFKDRQNAYVPICSAMNSACSVQWLDSAISIDGTRAADDPVPPYLDFRRSFTLTDSGREGHLLLADYGASKNGSPNMSWSYDGPCHKSDQPATPQRPPAQRVRNPNYQVSTAPAAAVSKEETDRVLASYYGNTMSGFSGGGHWFHMWFFDNGLAYTSDDQDMSGEGKPRQWYIGKDSTGYRICGQPIPPEGEAGCYPLLSKKVGDSWIESDMDGDAQFTLLPGRQ